MTESDRPSHDELMQGVERAMKKPGFGKWRPPQKPKEQPSLDELLERTRKQNDILTELQRIDPRTLDDLLD